MASKVYTQAVGQLYKEKTEKQEKVLLLLQLLPSYTKVNNNKCWEKVVTYPKKRRVGGKGDECDHR